MKKYVLGMAFLVGLLTFMACNEIGILSPPGPTGPEGKSAYQVWVEAVESGDIEWTSGTDLPNYFKYIKGEPGESAYDTWVEFIGTGDVDDPHNPGQKWDPKNNTMVDFYNFLSGAEGEDGLTPFINAAGNWQIGDIDTGVAAAGTDGLTPFINTDGNWQIGNTDTGVAAAGEDGLTPFINTDGNWQIGNTDTGIAAAGDKVTIDPTTGNWFINGEDTNVPATGPQGPQGEPGPEGPEGPQGEQGTNGNDGLSAYQIWLTEVENENIQDPGGNTWPDTSTDLQHFWYYIGGLYPNGTGGSITPIIDERTLLEFIGSVRNGDVGIFTFQTDPGATVTMNHEKTTVSVIANDQGVCEIEFPNSETREYYAVAYAEAPGKSMSYPLNIRIPIRADGYTLEIDWPNTIWWDNQGNQLDNSNEEYGYIDSTRRGTANSPYVVIKRGTDCTIWVPYRTENIAYIRVSQDSGLAQFYVEAMPNYKGSYEYGYITLQLTNYDNVTGNTKIYVDGYSIQDIPVVTLTFRATTN